MDATGRHLDMAFIAFLAVRDPRFIQCSLKLAF
jgi:hypothetical protein